MVSNKRFVLGRKTGHDINKTLGIKRYENDSA